VARTLFFDQTVFDEEVQLNAAAGRLSCRGTRFGGRADLNVRWAEVALDEATFAGRSRLAGAGPFPNIDESQARDFRVDRNLDAQARPRVLSLRQANVENLAVANVDLRACRSAPTASTSYASSPIATSPNLRRVGGTRAAALWPRSTTGTLAPPLRTLLRAPTPRPG